MLVTPLVIYTEIPVTESQLPRMQGHEYLQSKFSLRIIKNLNVCWTVTFSIFLRPEWRILCRERSIFCTLISLHFLHTDISGESHFKYCI